VSRLIGPFVEPRHYSLEDRSESATFLGEMVFDSHGHLWYDHAADDTFRLQISQTLAEHPIAQARDR
jgi:hypothetical protein